MEINVNITSEKYRKIEKGINMSQPEKFTILDTFWCFTSLSLSLNLYPYIPLYVTLCISMPLSPLHLSPSFIYILALSFNYLQFAFNLI